LSKIKNISLYPRVIHLFHILIRVELGSIATSSRPEQTVVNSLKPYDDFSANVVVNRLLFKILSHYPTQTASRLTSAAKNPTATSKNSLKSYDDFILVEIRLHVTASSMSSAPNFLSKFQNFFWKICQNSKKSNFRIRPQIADSMPRSRVIDKTRIHREKLSKNGSLELRSHKALYLMVFELKFFFTNYNGADFSLVFHSVRIRPFAPPPTYKVKEEKAGCSGSSGRNDNNSSNNKFNNKSFDHDQNTPASSNSATNTASSLSSAKNNHTASSLSSAKNIPGVLSLDSTTENSGHGDKCVGDKCQKIKIILVNTNHAQNAPASSLSSAKNNHTASRLSSATKIPRVLSLASTSTSSEQNFNLNGQNVKCQKIKIITNFEVGHSLSPTSKNCNYAVESKVQTPAQVPLEDRSDPTIRSRFPNTDSEHHPTQKSAQKAGKQHGSDHIQNTPASSLTSAQRTNNLDLVQNTPASSMTLASKNPMTSSVTSASKTPMASSPNSENQTVVNMTCNKTMTLRSLTSKNRPKAITGSLDLVPKLKHIWYKRIVSEFSKITTKLSVIKKSMIKHTVARTKC
jgi:hypothetical protein